MDTTNALTDLATVKSYLGIETADTTFDTTLERLIDSVSALFNVHTGRKLKSRSLTEYYDGDGGSTVWLDNYPITAVTNVYLDSTRGFAVDTAVPTANILTGARAWDYGRLTLKDYYTPEGQETVKVVYTGGYSTIPYDLANACREMIAFLYKRDKDGNRIGIQSVSFDGGSTNYVEDLPKSVKMVLELYRRPNG